MFRDAKSGPFTLALLGFGAAMGCAIIPGAGPATTGGADDCELTLPMGTPVIGTVSASSAVCEIGAQDGATCHEAIVSCAEVADLEVAIKYHPGAGVSLGTIILTSGGDGSEFYEDAFTYGLNLVEDLNQAGFATIQMAWRSDWTEGPGGVARLACRYATLAQWMYDELHIGGGAEPFCATGNSGGSAQIAYAMTRYGLADRFDAVVPSSGPPVGRIDLGCACTPGMDVADVPCGDDTLCYSTRLAESIDRSYEGSPCQELCLEVLAADSVVSDGVDLGYPTTKVVAVFGANDDSNAVAQGMQWYNMITSAVEIICVPEVGHSVASKEAGYLVLRDELIAECKLQP